MARILLAPVLDQHLLGADHRVAGGREARQPPAHDAAVRGRPGRAGAAVERGARCAPARRSSADRRVVRVEGVHVRAVREARVERQAEQTTVPEVVDLCPEIGEDVGLGVGERVEDLDEPALLGHEHPAVGGEPHHGGVRQSGEDRLLGEAGRVGGRLPRRAREEREQNRRRADDSAFVEQAAHIQLTGASLQFLHGGRFVDCALCTHALRTSSAPRRCRPGQEIPAGAQAVRRRIRFLRGRRAPGATDLLGGDSEGRQAVKRRPPIPSLVGSR